MAASRSKEYLAKGAVNPTKLREPPARKGMASEGSSGPQSLATAALLQVYLTTCWFLMHLATVLAHAWRGGQNGVSTVQR
eukprot:497449-Pyramimonas_sp.AAC.2